MSCQKKYTVPQGMEQATKLIDKEWEDQVLTKLPAETEEQAFLLGALRRCREIKSAGDLLRALLAYVLCVSSFRQLGSWAVLPGIANISDTAWRKRLKQANVWLLWLLAALLSGPAAPVERRTPCGLGRIILVDATRLKHLSLPTSLKVLGKMPKTPSRIDKEREAVKAGRIKEREEKSRHEHRIIKKSNKCRQLGTKGTRKS